jgi:hypothetical protein
MLRHGGSSHLLTLLEQSARRPAAACQHAFRSRALAVGCRTPIRTVTSVSLLDTKQVREPRWLPSRKASPKDKKALLEPHILSQRLKKLCDQGKLTEAIEKLKSSPLDAQNAVVWNTVIWECMKAKQYQLAYKLFVDVSNI